MDDDYYDNDLMFLFARKHFKLPSICSFEPAFIVDFVDGIKASAIFKTSNKKMVRFSLAFDLSLALVLILILVRALVLPDF